MIDSHCHIDQYDNPGALARDCEARKIRTVAVTSLPSHFTIAQSHLGGFSHVRPALGFHPLLAAKNAHEISKFEMLSEKVSLIGEIGLDGSKLGRDSLVSQIEIFDRILQSIRGKRRFVTIHSRQAVRESLESLRKAGMYPVVFHWFSGTKSEMAAILDAGHYLSVNPAMAASGRWEKDILDIPLDRILTETDGPYSKIDNRKTTPRDVSSVLEWLAGKHRNSAEEIEAALDRNFRTLQGAALWGDPL